MMDFVIVGSQQLKKFEALRCRHRFIKRRSKKGYSISFCTAEVAAEHLHKHLRVAIKGHIENFRLNGIYGSTQKYWFLDARH